MTSAEIIKQVDHWQQSKHVHPLTCGRNSQPSLLVAKQVGDSVILICPDCDYVQANIPAEVLSDYLSLIERFAYI